MHLRSLVLRGFKSFADRTQIPFDPGLVAVVGPNGAGKSNLIDALMWCLGTLSTRALRAEKMEDVIFTGTNHRPALGMSQVVITFDNSTGTFPLDFSEVQVGRTLFRDGASEYSINGATCRLLDVQELLSEAGIGRELHAVVAQGQVDDIVQSRPEELRAYVEEAAGISKHRRRKERALRKIEQVSQDIARAADLAGEMRRQLRPLRAQADQAMRYTEITERLREVRIRRLVGELETIEAERARAFASREGSHTELEQLREELAGVRTERDAAEDRLESSRRAASGVRRGLEHLRSAQASALRSVVVLRERAHARPDHRRADALAERRRSLDEQETEVRRGLEDVGGRIGATEDELRALRERRTEDSARTSAAAEELVTVRDELRSVEAEARATEQTEIAARAEARAAAEREERASDRINRLRSQADALKEDIERLDAEGGRAGMRVERLDGERRQAAGALDEADAKLRKVEAEAAVLGGRIESLRVARDMTASRRDGAEAIARAHGVELGARGVLGDAITVAPGFEAAVEAALGPALDALVVAGAHVTAAVAKAEDAGRDVVVAPTLPSGPPAEPVAGARPMASLVDAPGWLRGTVDALLEDAYVVQTSDEAAALAADHPGYRFVTPQGRVLASRGLSRPARSEDHMSLGLQQAIERAQDALRRTEAERGRWTTNRDRHARDVQRLDGELDEARSVLHELEGRIAAAADRLRELSAEEHGASLERELATREREDRLRRAEEAAATRATLAGRRAELEAREAALRTSVDEGERRVAASDDEIRSRTDVLSELLQARASLTERLRGIETSRDEVAAEQAEAAAPPTDPEDLKAAEGMLASLDAFVSRAEVRARELLDAEERVEDELRELSKDTSRLEVRVASLEPRSLQAAETVARLDVRGEEIGTRLAREFDIPPSQARAEFPAGDDEALAREERRLDAELRRMGPVNPLAAQEIATLTERQEFLEAQLEDLRNSRRDLLRVIRATDVEMREMLTSAIADAAERFGEVVEILFPEGGGRLRMTGEDDPLEAGIEIEVRLGRKGHRPLRLLSGGEKALAGLAFLFSLHLARPTPFLVLDEVDAPLDDANLGRFLRLLDSLRTRTQVLVVTHQKRTMERADSLIGVTLNPDGSSRVITERLREHVDGGGRRAEGGAPSVVSGASAS